MEGEEGVDMDREGKGSREGKEQDREEEMLRGRDWRSVTKCVE